MTLDQLQVFKTIIETGSFRAASEKLNRAQSAVSYAIKQLEEEVGTLLFSRETYRPSLTELGRAYYEKVQAVLKEQSELESLAQLLRDGVEPQLDLSFTALAPLSLITPTLQKFARKFPLTRLSFTADVLAADRCVISGEQDMAIAEPPSLNKELEAVNFGEVEMWPVIASTHPLVNSISRVDDVDLKLIPQIVVRSSIGGEDRTAGVLYESRSWRVSDFPSKLDLLRAGLGWGRMPSHWVEAEIASKSLKRLDDTVQFKVPLQLFRRRGKVGPAAAFLWDALLRA